MQKKKFNFKISLSQIQTNNNKRQNNSLIQTTQPRTQPNSKSYISLPLQSSFTQAVQNTPATTKSSSLLIRQQQQQQHCPKKNIQSIQLKQSVHSRNLYNTCRSSTSTTPTTQQQHQKNTNQHHLHNRPQYTTSSTYKSRPNPHPDNQYNPKLPSNNTSATSSSNSSFLFSQATPHQDQKKHRDYQNSNDNQYQQSQQQQQYYQQQQSTTQQQNYQLPDQTTCLSSLSVTKQSNTCYNNTTTTQILGIRQILERQQKLNNSSIQMRTSMSLLKSSEDDYQSYGDDEQDLQKLLKDDSKNVSVFSDSIASNSSDNRKMIFNISSYSKDYQKQQQQRNKVKAVLNLAMKTRNTCNNNKNNYLQQSNSCTQNLYSSNGGVSCISSNSKITNSSVESIPQIQISLGSGNNTHHNNNLPKFTNPCTSNNNSNSNLLYDDDLTMELSSNNTTIFNYSSNERGVLASSGNNFNVTNNTTNSNIKTRCYNKNNTPEDQRDDDVLKKQKKKKKKHDEQLPQLLDFREYTEGRQSNEIDLLESLNNDDMNQLLRLSVSTTNAEVKPSILQSNKSSFCGNSVRCGQSDGEVNFSTFKPPSVGTKSDFSPLNSSCNGNSPELIYDSYNSKNSNKINPNLQIAIQPQKHSDSNQILAFGFEKQHQTSLGHNSSCDSNGNGAQLSSGNSTPVGTIQATYTVASSHGSVIEDGCCLLEQNRLDDFIKTERSQDNTDQTEQLMIREKLHQQQMMYYNHRCKHSIYSTILEHPDQQQSECPASRQSHVDLLLENDQVYSQVSKKHFQHCNNNNTTTEQEDVMDCRDIHSVLGKEEKGYFAKDDDENNACSNNINTCNKFVDDEQQTSPMENLITFQGTATAVGAYYDDEYCNEDNNATAEFQTQKRKSSSIRFVEQNESTINYQTSIEHPHQNRPVSRLDNIHFQQNNSVKEYFQFEEQEQSQQMLRKPIISSQQYPQMPPCSASPFIQECLITETSPENPSILQLMLMNSQKKNKNGNRSPYKQQQQQQQQHPDTIVSYKNTAEINPSELLNNNNNSSSTNFHISKQNSSSSSSRNQQNSASQFSCSRYGKEKQYYQDICRITQQSEKPDQLIAEAIDGVSIQQSVVDDNNNIRNNDNFDDNDDSCYVQTADFRTNNILPPLSGSVSQNLTRIQSSSTIRAITPTRKNEQSDFDSCSPILLGHILKNSQRGKRRKQSESQQYMSQQQQQQQHQQQQEGQSDNVVNQSLITLHMHSQNSDYAKNQSESVATQKKLDDQQQQTSSNKFYKNQTSEEDDQDDDYEQHIVGDQFNRDSLIKKNKLGGQSTSSIELQKSGKIIKKCKKRMYNEQDVRSSLMPSQKFGVIPVIDIKSKSSSQSNQNYTSNNLYCNTVQCHLNTSNQNNFLQSTPNSGRMALVFSSDSKRNQKNLPKKQLFLQSQICNSKENINNHQNMKKKQKQKMNIENVLIQNSKAKFFQQPTKQKQSINRRSTLSQVQNTSSPPFKNVQNISHNTVASKKMIPPPKQPLSSTTNNQKLFEFYKKSKDCTIKPKNPLTLHQKKGGSFDSKQQSSNRSTSVHNYQSASSCSSRVPAPRQSILCSNSNCTTPSTQKPYPQIRNKQNNSKMSLVRTETTNDEISRVENLMMLDISINSVSSKQQQQQQQQQQQLNNSVMSQSNFLFNSICGEQKQNTSSGQQITPKYAQKLMKQLQLCNQQLRKKEKQAQNYQRQLKLKDKVIEQLQKQNQSLHVELAQAYCQLQEQNACNVVKMQ